MNGDRPQGILLWAHTWGTARPHLRNLTNELVAVGTPMSALPGFSRFWAVQTTNDTILLTWENFALGRILGIQPLSVGCKEVRVRPFLGDLDWAEGAMALPDGRAVRVRVAKNADGTLKVDIDAPSDIKVSR